MKRLGILLQVALAVVLAQLGWTWLQRHDADLRLRRWLDGRRSHSVSVPDNGAVRIDQFYARAAEILDGENDVICYGVRNANTVRLEPPVENLTPALVRCFWVEPRQDTTYRLVAQGPYGARA